MWALFKTEKLETFWNNFVFLIFSGQIQKVSGGQLWASLMYSNLYTGSHEQEQKRKNVFSSFNSREAAELLALK